MEQQQKPVILKTLHEKGVFEVKEKDGKIIASMKTMDLTTWEEGEVKEIEIKVPQLQEQIDAYKQRIADFEQTIENLELQIKLAKELDKPNK